MIGSYSYSSDLWPAFITLALAIFLGSYTWRRRNIPAAKPFIIACFLAGFWILGTILELSAENLSTKLFWIKFQAIWQLPLGATMTCFILQFGGLGRWLNRRNYMLLFLFPMLSVLLMVTNDFHHLIWTGFRMNGHVIPSPGKLYWVFHSYIYLLGFLNFVVLIWLAISSPAHRLAVATMLSGQIIARVGYTLDKLDGGLIGPGESVFFTLGVVAAAYALAFLRFYAIDPVASARKAVLEQMHQGMIVLDLQGRVADANPMAAAMLEIPGIELRGRSLTDIMPIDEDVIGKSDNHGITDTEIILKKDNSARHYNLNLTSLRGRRDELIGQLLLLHDVTEQKRAQTRILEQQSVVATLKERQHLARELHDGIGQVLGYTGIQAQAALKWVHDGNIEKAESLLGRLVEVAKDAHADVRESIISLRAGAGQEWSFVPILRQYLDRFQANYDIRTELSLSDGIEEETFDPAVSVHLMRVIQEALTNCRKHSGAHSLRICLELDGNKATIQIGDDGDGFDASCLERSDGNHFGLVFMQERMEQIGGSLTIGSMPGSGTVLKLDLPIREREEAA